MNTDGLRCLVKEFGAEVNAQDDEGRAALSYYCTNNHANADGLRCLIVEFSAEVNAQDRNGATPLSWAAQTGNTDTVRVLLMLQADPSITDNSNRTARDYAARNGHRRTQEVLTSYVSQHQLWAPSLTFQPQKWSIRATEIELGDFAAASDVGGDFFGKWLDADVVIKLWVSSSVGGGSFKEHVDRWFALRHPNVQKLYGAVHDGLNLFVCEHMENGSLEKFISRYQSNPSRKDAGCAARYLYEAALGLQFLHEREIAHKCFANV